MGRVVWYDGSIEKVKVIIAGGRDLTDYEVCLRGVEHSGFDITEVVSGHARGADTLGEQFAKQTNLPLKLFPADWSKHGRAAGPIRNNAMAAYADALIALWDGSSKGTRHMIQQARKLGLPVHIEYYNWSVKMPWIENVALADIPKGFHHDAGINAMLIQIVDPDMEFPEPKHQFKEVHQFKFLDVEADDKVLDESMRCTQEQANELVRLLQHAMEHRMNVVVHCHAGVCRSGAVCEVGVMMGFNDTERFRSPNLLVKHQMMKALGWTYDENEPHTINGVPYSYDDLGNKKVYTQTDAGLWIPPDGDI